MFFEAGDTCLMVVKEGKECVVDGIGHVLNDLLFQLCQLLIDPTKNFGPLLGKFVINLIEDFALLLSELLL